MSAGLLTVLVLVLALLFVVRAVLPALDPDVEWRVALGETDEREQA